MRTGIRYLLAGVALMLLIQPVLGQEDMGKLKSKVRGELGRYYSDVSSFRITVREGGKVTLDGTVDSFRKRRRVFNIVARVPGVTAISNRLVVETEAVPDNTLKASIESQLKRTTVVQNPGKVEVSVDKGTVILKGTVGVYREALEVEELVSWQKGVKGIVNEIQVQPAGASVSDEGLTASARDVIDRFYPLQKKTVQVKVAQGKASLSGTVTTLWARREIEKSVRRILGVTGVQNDLTVVAAR